MNANQIQLIVAKVEILKLKADDHSWQCYVPQDVKDQLEVTLTTINKILEEKA